MKNYYKVSIVVLAVSMLPACSVKSTASNPTTSTGVNTTATLGTGTTGTTGTTGGTTTTTGGIACDGVNNNTGAIDCYYRDIPTIQVMGVTRLIPARQFGRLDKI